MRWRERESNKQIDKRYIQTDRKRVGTDIQARTANKIQFSNSKCKLLPPPFSPLSIGRLYD